MQNQTSTSTGIKLLKDLGDPLFVPRDRRELAQLPAAGVNTLRPEVLADVEGILKEPGAEAFPLAAPHVVAGVMALLHGDPPWGDAVVGTARFEEARCGLTERGIALDGKTVRSPALDLGEQVLAHRRARIAKAAQSPLWSGEFAG